MELNIGIVGAGNFARFAVKVFLQIPGIKIVAVTDVDDMLVKQVAAEWNAIAYSDYEIFLEDERINLVYIATPPFLHYGQSKLALLKGKHVICEKPAALKTTEAEELAELSRSSGLLWVVNLMQRYNPLYDIVKKIIEEKILGKFLHGFFENYASDENLDRDHWFWDETKSGGIFIEHGVHFFDMFSGWLGEGKLQHALELKRKVFGREIVDRLQATVLYDECSVNFYHGFDQPKILDRQEMRLQFERGEITLHEWIPVNMRLHGILQNEQLNRLKELLENFTVIKQEAIATGEKAKGRFKDIFFDTHITLDYGNTADKQIRYEELLKAMLLDQWNWIRDNKYKTIIDHSNATGSLQMAEAANLFAKNALQK